MPAYLITHPKGKQSEDILLEDPAVSLHFTGGWAVFTDSSGPCLAIPAGRDAVIQRIDEPGPHDTPPIEDMLAKEQP